MVILCKNLIPLSELLPPGFHCQISDRSNPLTVPSQQGVSGQVWPHWYPVMILKVLLRFVRFPFLVQSPVVVFTLAGKREADCLCCVFSPGKLCIERRLSALLSGFCA